MAPPRPSARSWRSRPSSSSFGGTAAVDGISLAVRPREIVGLIGPNGAGKTTLFDCIAGEQTPTSGRVLLGERAVEREPAHRRLAAGLARTFQIPRPFAQMTLVENVMLGAQGQSGERILPNWLSASRVAREERATFARAMELLDFVTLAKLAHQPARVLSGGQRKLLELARALMAEPAILLLDEPAAGVNPTLLEVIVARIAEINRLGTAVLVIEHNMEMVARLCDHVFVMAAGAHVVRGAARGGRHRSAHDRGLSRRRRRMSEPILTAEAIVAGYELGLPIVQGSMRFSVNVCEIVAIDLGPNGAGKSTLIKAIAGPRAGDLSGRVMLGDRERSLLRAEYRDGAAWVSPFFTQTENVFAGMTVDDNLRPAAIRLPLAERSQKIARENLLPLFPILRASAGLFAGLLRPAGSGRCWLSRARLLVVPARADAG